ncbi:MAG: nuclear transport factor 2 family protein [Deltaproteobacteria bacterium]|nr:nuclear transport factor 2 family protein [Deltaproteobacteria bacterium]
MTEPILHPTLARYFDALCALDFAAVASCFAADGLQEDPVGGGVRRGPAEVHAFLQQIGAAFASIELRPTRVYSCGGEIALVWEARGRGKNGAEVRFHGIDVVILDVTGEIRSLRAFWDPAPVLAALSAR